MGFDMVLLLRSLWPGWKSVGQAISQGQVKYSDDLYDACWSLWQSLPSQCNTYHAVGSVKPFPAT